MTFTFPASASAIGARPTNTAPAIAAAARLVEL
jgi:hypothetical protein